MTNLLPTEERNVVRREYLKRLATVMCVLLSVAIGLGALFLLPTFFLVQSEVEAIEERHALLQRAIKLREQDISSEEITEVKEKLAVLQRDEEDMPAINNSIMRVIENAGPGIRLGRFFLNANETEYSELRLSGVASSREQLTAFADALRREPRFQEINLPVSQLAKGENIEFSITITGTF